ncbi:STE/STE20 protein kinase [Xylaria cf. heliscus]|nr:STE/STE20 protein kinase [Xylaria cf. heliscus]
MSSLLRVGQALRGRAGVYTVSKNLYSYVVWLAQNENNDPVIVKSVTDHPRVENERDILKRFQSKSPYLRPLIDEIQDPVEPTTIVLTHLETGLLEEARRQPLNKKEIKYVSRRVLRALSVLHKEGYIHTDIKLNNIFVNLKPDADDIRFSDVQLGDFGGSSPRDSKWPTSGTFMGTPIWTSPEVLLKAPWNTAADIWSFGTLLISMIYGGDFNPFYPKDIPYGDKAYNFGVLMKQYRRFGPFPVKLTEIFDEEKLTILMRIMDMIPDEEITLFRFVTEREVDKVDKEFILKIMHLDWRDRPTAEELLQDEWFREE